MNNPLSIFHDKDAPGSPWSMTRFTVFMFAVTFCFTLYKYADKAVAITWPFTMLGFAILGAVPLIGMLSYLQHWIASRPGNALLATLVDKFAPGIGSTVSSTTSSTMISTQAATPSAPKGER